MLSQSGDRVLSIGSSMQVTGTAPQREPCLCFLQESFGPRPVSAVMTGEQRESNRHGVDATAPQLRYEHEVAAALRHLLAVETDHSRVHVMTCEADARVQRLGMCGAEFVMREDEVGSTALNVEAGADPVDRDRGTFDVPAGTSRPER